MNEQTPLTPAKQGTVFYKAKVGLWRIIRIVIRIIVNNVFTPILAFLVGLIPVVGGIIAIILYVLLALSNLLNLIELIVSCCASTKITSTGICGFDENCIPFDLPASRIYSVSNQGSKVYIEGYVVKKNGKMRECTVITRVSRAKHFVQAYRDNRIKMIVE